MDGRKMIALALAACALGGCRGPTLTPWSGPAFSVSYPVGWRVQTDGADTVTFDGTTLSGIWRVGRTLRLTRVERTGPFVPNSLFSSDCGSHVCTSTFEAERDSYILTLVDTCPTDDCPHERLTMVQLHRLAKSVMETIQIR